MVFNLLKRGFEFPRLKAACMFLRLLPLRGEGGNRLYGIRFSLINF